MHKFFVALGIRLLPHDCLDSPRCHEILSLDLFVNKRLLVSLVVVENRFFGIGAQIFLSQLPYNERSLNSQRLSIPPSRGFQR